MIHRVYHIFLKKITSFLISQIKQIGEMTSDIPYQIGRMTVSDITHQSPALQTYTH